MSKCIICGRELLTGDVHWEIGQCNECYDIGHKRADPYFEIQCDTRLLRKREEYIKSLEQQLAEKDKEIEILKDKNNRLGQTMLEDTRELENLKTEFQYRYKIISHQICKKIRKEFEKRLTGCKWEDKLLVGKFCNITNDVLDQIEKGE